jgi:hypothetical protein
VIFLLSLRIASTQKPVFGERVIPVLANDDMIEDADGEQVARFAKVGGAALVFGRRGGITGRMVMEANHGSGAVMDRRPEHLAGIDGAGVKRAFVHLLKEDHPVLRIKAKHREDLGGFEEESSKSPENLF